MMLSELAKAVHGQLVGDDCPVDGVSIDSRTLTPGELFVALKGNNFDGHRYLRMAVERGASALVVEVEDTDVDVPQVIVADTCVALGLIAAHNRQQFAGKVIAITGSSGKTTVKGMLHHILEQQGDVVSTKGNFNNHIGVPLSLLRLAKQDFAVIELGTSHPGEIAYLTQLVEPDVALVNNVMPAHIQGFGSLAAIAKEKGEIYSCRNADQTAVINLDSDFRDQFIKKTGACTRFGFTRKADSEVVGFHVMAGNEHLDADGYPSFDLFYRSEKQSIRLGIMGAHNINNALAAAACALAVGSSLPNIAVGLSAFGGERGRMELRRSISGARVVDDSYNANPGSVRASIDFLAACPGRGVLVLGDLGELGDSAESAHREIGRYAASKNLAALYAIGAGAALAAESFGAHGFVFTDKQSLAHALLSDLSVDATILVKGSRSSRMEEVVQMLCGAGEDRSC